MPRCCDENSMHLTQSVAPTRIYGPAGQIPAELDDLLVHLMLTQGNTPSSSGASRRNPGIWTHLIRIKNASDRPAEVRSSFFENDQGMTRRSGYHHWHPLFACSSLCLAYLCLECSISSSCWAKITVISVPQWLQLWVHHQPTPSLRHGAAIRPCWWLLFVSQWLHSGLLPKCIRWPCDFSSCLVPLAG